MFHSGNTMKLLPLSIAFVLSLLVSFNSFAEDLEQLLRNQLGEVNKAESPLLYCVPITSLRLYFWVPPTLAAILDSHTEEELVPVLTSLKASVNASDALLVQNWITIAKSHVRGTPDTVNVSSGSSSKSVPTVLYALPLYSRRP